MDPLKLSTTQLAEAMEIQPHRLRHLLQGAISMNADLAVRLSKTLGCSPSFWMDLQKAADLYEAILASEGWTLPCLNPGAKYPRCDEPSPCESLENSAS